MVYLLLYCTLAKFVGVMTKEYDVYCKFLMHNAVKTEYKY